MSEHGAREIAVELRRQRQKHLRDATRQVMDDGGRLKLGGGGKAGILPVAVGGTGNDQGAAPHALTGDLHTASGLTTGHVLTATGADSFAFQAPSGGGGVPLPTVAPVPVPAIYTPTGHAMRAGILTGSGYQAFPGMCRFPQDHALYPGRIYVVYRDGTSHGEDQGVVKRIYSDDGGLTWSTPATILSDATYDVIEAFPIVLANGDVLIAYTLEAFGPPPDPLADGARVRVSTDGGETYGAAVTLNSAWTDWSYCAAPAVQLANGDVLVPLYGQDSGDADTGVSVMRSTNGGASFGSEVVVVDGATGGRSYSEPNLARRPDDDTLLMLIRTDDNTIYRATAAADGTGWTAPAATSMTTTNGNPHMAWLASGALVVFSRRYHATLAQQISTFYTSLDYGATYSGENVLDATVNRNLYSAGAALDGHTIGVIYSIEPTYNSDADLYWAALADAPPPWQAVNADMVDGWHKADIAAAIAAAIPAALDDLGDVDAPSPSVGDALVWDGSAWVADRVARWEPFSPLYDNDGKVLLTNEGWIMTKSN